MDEKNNNKEMQKKVAEATGMGAVEIAKKRLEEERKEIHAESEMIVGRPVGRPLGRPLGLSRSKK